MIPGTDKKRTQDRLRLEQEDAPHDAVGPQGIPRSQLQRHGHAPHAQPHLRRRVRSAYLLQSMDPRANKSSRISHAVSARKRVEILKRAKQLGVKVTNSKAKVTTES